MPRTKAKPPSKSAVFRGIYESNLDLLKVPGYDELFKIYQAEDSSRKVGVSERQVAANVKSTLRHKHKIRGRRRGRRGRRGRMSNGAVAPAMMAPQRVGAHLALEDAIDDCIFLARKMDAARLEDVVRLLKKARNQLIVMTGK